MIRVLNITEILPHPEISSKVTENDILLQIEKRLTERYDDIYFQHINILPKTPWLLSIFSSKWKEYYKAQKKQYYFVKKWKIFVIGVFQLPRKTKYRNILYEISYFFNRKKIDDVVNSFKPTVIHAQNSDIDAFIARKISMKYKIPYLVTLRGLDIVSDSFVKRNVEESSYLIALSPKQKQQAIKISSIDPVLLPHGISDNFFEQLISEKKREGVIKLVSVCRLIPLKKIDKVVDSLSRCNYNFIYHIYGDGPEKEHLQKTIHSRNLGEKIVLKGRVKNSELPEILPSYDYFIMPSKPEAFGLVYFEAMACGLPVIASRDTGIDGIIKHGKEGFLVDHSKPDSIDEILANLEASDWTQMSLDAIQLSKSFSWNMILPTLYELYKVKKL